MENATTAELLSWLYAELRQMAQGHMDQENGPLTLTATALVHEAWLRLAPAGQWQNRRHFFGAAAEAMRRILIDRARQKLTGKRGSRPELVPLEGVDIAAETADEDLLDVHEALDGLRAVDGLAAEIVSLRYFGGLPWIEISELTGLSERDLQRQWSFARSWLHAAITALRK